MTTFLTNDSNDNYRYKINIINETNITVHYDFNWLLNGRVVDGFTSPLVGVLPENTLSSFPFSVNGGLIIHDCVNFISFGEHKIWMKFWCGGSNFNILSATLNLIEDSILGGIAGAAGGAIEGGIGGGIVGATGGAVVVPLIGSVPGAAFGSVVGALAAGVGGGVVGVVGGAIVGVKSGIGSNQYINFLALDEFKVNKNTSEYNSVVCEMDGVNYKISVDGGGVNNPKTTDIYIRFKRA